MFQNASDIMLDTLHKWGVEVVFGIPGDGINGIIEAFRKREKDIRFIQVRHEEAAAFAATAYAKLTGKLGVCVATSGPGGIHLLNGLYDAKLDGAPVLAITGLQFHDLINTHTQQDVELDKLFENVAVYSCRIMGAAHVENATELACRTALSYRSVAHITMPVDLQETPVSKDLRSRRNVPHHVSNIMARRASLPEREQMQRAADILNAGKKTVILAGRGALGCGDLLEEIADTLGAVIAKPLLGKGAVSDESPHCTGSVGILGTKPSYEALKDCDTLLIVGSSFPYVEFYPKPDEAKCVQIDIDPVRIGLRFPTDVGLVGQARPILEELRPLLHKSNERAFSQKIQDLRKDWRQHLEKTGTVQDAPMKPQVVGYELNKLLADDAIVLSDSGTIATWFARYVDMKGERMFTLSGNLATMACGLPYAVGAQVAYTGRQVVAMVGDGGFTMLMAELLTAKKYDLPIKIIVFKNNALGQIKWEQMGMLGNPEYVCELQPFDFVQYAEACGVKGFRIDDPQDCAKVLSEALTTEGPVVVEAVVDPHEPPLPAHIDFSQAKAFTEAMIRGTPARGQIMKTIAKDMVRELI